MTLKGGLGMSRDRISGTFEYDGLLDVLYVRCRPELEYDQTLDIGNVLVDLDNTPAIKRIEILDASKLFGASVFELKNILKMDIDLVVSKDRIDVALKLEVLKRSRHVPMSYESYILNDYGLSENTINVSAVPALA